MLQRAWQGRIEDIPEKFEKGPASNGFGCVIIYSNGSRTYHRGLKPSPVQISEISRVMSLCWDSIPSELKEALNNRSM